MKQSTACSPSWRSARRVCRDPARDHTGWFVAAGNARGDSSSVLRRAEFDAFLAKVERGVYCAPTREKGCLPKWHRLKLDRDIARRHGLRFDNVAIAEDVTGLI